MTQAYLVLGRFFYLYFLQLQPFYFFLLHCFSIIPRGGIILQVIPYGVPIWSLSVLYLPPRKLFWFQILEWNRPFWILQIFYPPLRELLKCSPMGSHLSLFLFYILPQLIFLTSNSLWRIGLFFARDFLYWRMGWDGMDGMGWDGWDGWMGWSVHFFFFCSYLENYLIIIHNFFWNF